MQQDDSVKMQELDDYNQRIEDLAEELMKEVEISIASSLRNEMVGGRCRTMTRADIGELCRGDDFNNLFYEMAKKVV